jgi:hypothetical protein
MNNAELFDCVADFDPNLVPCPAPFSVASLAEMPDVSTGIAGQCDAAVWNWTGVTGAVKLVDLRDTTIEDIVLQDIPCDSLGIRVTETTDGQHYVVVTVHAREARKWIALPMVINRGVQQLSCDPTSFSCTAPQL